MGPKLSDFMAVSTFRYTLMKADYVMSFVRGVISFSSKPKNVGTGLHSYVERITIFLSAVEYDIEKKSRVQSQVQLFAVSSSQCLYMSSRRTGFFPQSNDIQLR